jgi:hypothetical protein
MLVGNKKVDESNVWEHLSKLSVNSTLNSELKNLGEILKRNVSDKNVNQNIGNTNLNNNNLSR